MIHHLTDSEHNLPLPNKHAKGFYPILRIHHPGILCIINVLTNRTNWKHVSLMLCDSPRSPDLMLDDSVSVRKTRELDLKIYDTNLYQLHDTYWKLPHSHCLISVPKAQLCKMTQYVCQIPFQSIFEDSANSILPLEMHDCL